MMKTKGNSENVLVSLLEALNVKHTKFFSNKYLNENPHKNSLYGLSKILSDYSIENQGYRVKDKNSILNEIETPFIAHVNNDFVMVYKTESSNVKYLWKGKKINASMDEFIKNWSGALLLAEATEDSIEPDYKAHRKQTFFFSMKKIILLFACIFVLSIIGIYTELYNNLMLIFALCINLFGLYISYLLVLKQLKIHNNQADKICSLLIHQSDCNSILDSNAAKIFGFSWSEIGFGYFLGNLVTIIILPLYYPYIAWINICALPYTLWSLWYQKFKAQQWCPLCLIVQGILWILFFYDLFAGLIELPEFSIMSIVLICSVFLIPVLVINIFNSIISEVKNKEKISQELNSLKSNEQLFNMLIKEKPKYAVDKTDSTILLGNMESENLVTIISNPHCNPCARLHKKLKYLLENGLENFCIQYILTSFNESLECSNKFIIAMHQKLDQSEFLSFLDEWYDDGRNNINKMFHKYSFDCENFNMQNEFNKHKEWINKTKIMATPTILFNGYEFPQNIYKIEDLLLLSDINIS